MSAPAIESSELWYAVIDVPRSTRPLSLPEVRFGWLVIGSFPKLDVA